MCDVAVESTRVISEHNTGLEYIIYINMWSQNISIVNREYRIGDANLMLKYIVWIKVNRVV